MGADVEGITWKLTGEAREDVAKDRATLGEEEYTADAARLRDELCAYFETGKCSKKHGTMIARVGKTGDGGKVLKVRWGRPGCGRSGGVRMCFVVYCEERLVILARVFLRKEDPSDDEFEAAGKLADRDR